MITVQGDAGIIGAPAQFKKMDLTLGDSTPVPRGFSSADVSSARGPTTAHMPPVSPGVFWSRTESGLSGQTQGIRVLSHRWTGPHPQTSLPQGQRLRAGAHACRR